MRVTVCFGQTRVIVPCKGGATVAELVKEACARYKKAIGKGPKYWVKIRQLENAIDGGILDIDDYVYDVAEDRDQLIAIFEEEDDQTYRYNGWDHHSGSGSEGHHSPLSFQHHQVLNNRFSNEKPSVKRGRNQAPTGNATVIKHDKRELEVNVGVEALKSSSNSNITVRRGSDPSMNKAEANSRNGKIKKPTTKNPAISHHYYSRRQSGSGQEEDILNSADRGNKHQEIMITTANSSPDQNLSVVTASSDTNVSIDSGHHSIKAKHGHESSGSYGNFVRGATRQSIMGMLEENSDENAGYDRTRRQPPDGRKQNSSDLEDLSSSYQAGYEVEPYLPPPPKDPTAYPTFYNDTQEMFVEIDTRPLGIKVTCHRDHKVFCGLLVESVDEGGRSDREGLLQEGDVIVEINNYVLAQYSLSVAQEIFKNAMKFPELQLRVYPIEERERVSSTGNAIVENNNALNRHRHTPSIPVLSLVEATPPKTSKISAAKSLPDLNASSTSKLAQDVSPNGKVPLVARMSLDTLSNNTRKIGNMFEIELRKGEQGLGFSITTRDTPVGDPGPIYIKNILPKGAAIQDGRLHAGDRLLRVNDIEMTGHTQESAVSILRCIEAGSTVRLVVSRHISTLPRKLKDDPVTDKVLSDDSNKEYFKFEIALNDTGSAGLGISLKGNQSKKTKKDLGIFVKSVFHGGAAYQDGRLKPNDQLVSVNGQSLIGMTNHEAIDTLRTSMSTEGNVRGMIQMVIARRKPHSGDPTSPQFSSEASSEMSDSLINERNSRSFDNQWQLTSAWSSRALSPVGTQNHATAFGTSHARHFSDLSYESSIFSSSLGDDTSFGKNEDSEVWSHIDNSLPRSSKVISPKEIRKITPLRRHTSLRSTNKEQYTGSFADTINRYTQSSSPTSPQYKNLIGDLLRSAAIDNHYKPRRLVQKSGTFSKSLKLIDRDAISASRKPPYRSLSLRAPKNKDAYDVLATRPPVALPARTRGVGGSPPARYRGKMEKSPFDKLTAFEITGHSREENFIEDSVHYQEEIPRQIDPNPLDAYNGTIYEDSAMKRDYDWTPSRDLQDPEIDPFSRESIFRQSISEKRRGAASRDAQSTDTYKVLKTKQLNATEIEKKPATPDSKNSTPVTSLKWVKPSSAKNHHSTPAHQTTKSPMRSSPGTARKNLNNSSNLPVKTENARLEPEVEVGPTLGIAKSSSLESLQTAVENYVDSQEAPFPKAQQRVLRGRVLNESFRAALDQSYDMDNLTTKPMATLKEEGQSNVSPLVKSAGSTPTGQKTNEKKRTGKGSKFFGLFRVGKNKRSLSSDRNLDSFSSTSSSPRVSESEAHKKLLEAKREDDFKKHQAETERIQAKAKAMREQQESRRKTEEIRKSKEDLTKPKLDERIRAPSVPVTAMQRVNIDPKVSYSEVPSGRRSVDPTTMRNHPPQTFDWHAAKRPTSPVDYGDRSRHRRPEKKSSVNKMKTNPDYSSLPRQPRFESHAGTIPVDSDRAVTLHEGQATTTRSPNKEANAQSRRSGSNSTNFNNYEFYNMQKPTASKRHTVESKTASNVSTERQGRPEKSKVGRTLYYDDLNDSESSTSQSNGPSRRRKTSPKLRARPASTINGFELLAAGNSFHREESPEPPPVVHRDPRQQATSNYRHSVHVSSLNPRLHERRPNAARSPEPPSFKWKPHSRRNNHDQSDSDSYRTVSPASSGAAERNRDAVKKILQQTHYGEQHGGESIVISPPYNL